MVGGASCKVVYGQTTGPKEECFEKFIGNWGSLDTEKYSLIEVPRHMRELASHISVISSFLQNWIKNSTKEKLRHDYLELATLTLLFLGGSMPAGLGVISIKAPGAFHHARWMSKALYTLKIALFRNQLRDVYTPDQLENIYNLAIFISIFYSQAWLTCTSATNAPSNDLDLMKKFLKAESSIKLQKKHWPTNFLDLVSAARGKMENHLWYLSERLVPFALFSDIVTSSEKEKLRKAMLKNQGPVTNTIQEMPHSNNLGSKTLRDFIGKDSWTMFKLLGINPDFLNLSVDQWNVSTSYLHGKEVLSNLPVVNDAAERALGLATEMNTKTIPKSELQLQAIYKVVKGIRDRLRCLATSTEVVTKKALKSVDYKWNC